MKFFLSAFIIITQAFVGFAQESLKGKSFDTLRPSIKRLADNIAKCNELDSEAVGEAGVTTEQWRRYEKLNTEATYTELKLLTDHANSVVRCYAFQALSHRAGTELYGIVVKHLSDTSRLRTLTGCIGGREMSGDYFLGVVTPDYVDLSSRKLTATERKRVDSILLYDKNIKLSARSSLLSRVQPNLVYHDRIKEIVTTENEPTAMIALARFKNKDDINIIKRFFDSEKTDYYAIYATIEFPDLTFYPYLVKIFEREWDREAYDYPKWRVLYQALSKYPVNKTLDLFNQTVKSTDEFRYQTLGVYLTAAIIKYPNKLYGQLKDEIKLDKIHLDEVAEEIKMEK